VISKIAVNAEGVFDVLETPTYAENKKGDKRYELANHLGNVLDVVTDRKLPVSSGGGSPTVASYTADVVTYSDYYPFGMVLPGRNYTGADYRYGFNGMEKDDELKQVNNSYDFGARMYDPRVGRWLSRDPNEAKYPAQSGYTFSLNSPLLYKDPDGKDAIVTIDKATKTVTYTSTVYLMGTGVTQEYVDLVQAMDNYHFDDVAGIVKLEDGQTYILKIDVTYVNATPTNPNYESLPPEVKQWSETGSASPAPLASKGELAGMAHGSNVVFYDGQNVNTSSRASDSQAWIQIYKQSKIADPVTHAAYATIHEVLHLLGLTDRYNQEVKQPTDDHDNFENDWMSGEGTEKSQKISSWTNVEFNEAHVRNLVKAGLSIYGNKNNKVTDGKGAVFYTIYQNLLQGNLDKDDPNREKAKIYGEEY
jgi:RHS repeat-associated protein